MTKTIVEAGKLPDQVVQYLQEIGAINPYDHSDHSAFRDPNKFPPFEVSQKSTYQPLPLKTFQSTESEVKKYWDMFGGNNVTSTGQMGKGTSPPNVDRFDWSIS